MQLFANTCLISAFAFWKESQSQTPNASVRSVFHIAKFIYSFLNEQYVFVLSIDNFNTTCSIIIAKLVAYQSYIQAHIKTTSTQLT